MPMVLYELILNLLHNSIQLTSCWILFVLFKHGNNSTNSLLNKNYSWIYGLITYNLLVIMAFTIVRSIAKEANSFVDSKYKVYGSCLICK